MLRRSFVYAKRELRVQALKSKTIFGPELGGCPRGTNLVIETDGHRVSQAV